MPISTRNSIAVMAFVVVLVGCNARIPNNVTPDEYAVYSEWMKAYFSKSAPSNLYVGSRTFVFDPLSSSGCGNTLHANAGVPWSLIKQLHALGEAEFRLAVYSPGTSLYIPWNYRVVDDWRLAPEQPGSYRLVSFSRVAFDHAHSQALFAFSDTCGGDCGHGGPIYAHKNKGARVFESVAGCVWHY
ncbi:MAG TPA: hypothetical protein VK302_20780 [Terriglobales bacterium]|nr:hypothetical protein [Terriglobales bacterium]